MNILSIVIEGAIIMLLLAIFARQEADFSFPKALLLAALLGLFGGLLSVAIGIFALPLILAGMVWGLRQLFYLSWKKAFTVTGAYIVLKVLLIVIL